MARISTYARDTDVIGSDRWIGTSWDTADKLTKNFTSDAVASYFNKSAIIDTGQFSWEFLPYNNTQPQPEKTFMKVDWLDDTININNLAGVLRVSALTLGNTQPGAFIENEWVGNNILIHLPSAPSAYAIYTVDALVPDGDWYYLMTISYVGGQSFVIQKNEPVVMGYFAGANVITEITGTFPIIVSEGSIPDVSIDETKLGEWNLAFNSTITSASVTGTTTKTLTLTEQDGGTITASWTDEDTNLVTSVFGRTGAVVAVSGDYNTSQVTESTNLYFTQARAIASPITGYNPTLGIITATDTILTAINKLAGSYVPYTGATTNVNLGEKGITAGYVGFDLTPTATPTGIGTMYWDSAYRTVSLIDGDGDTTLQIGQEERILVHNNTGSTLTDGQVVYVTGSTGNLPSVSLADASSETTSAATLGVVTESIANGADGFITVSGMVNGLNTLAFAEGDLLWLSETAGQFTNVKPIAPAHLVLIGYVIKRAGGNGSILVKIQNTQELSESSDVLISAPEIDGQGLFLQTISGVQLWRNRSIIDVLGYTPADEATTLTINGTTYDLSANRTWSVGTVTSIAVGLGTSGTDVNLSGSPITSSGTITLNIPSASAVNRGLLIPTDWTTFNNKQDAGNYITSLTGEATASGPGAAAVTLSTPAVTGKLLTGVNITGGTVVATDTILEAFGKVQNQINGLVGGSIYKGTWNAATNTPTITSGVGNTGWYYIVSVSGSTNIDGITDWNLGDWIIFDGTAWQQVDNTDAVVSVNGYTGAVSLVSSDVPEGLTNLYFTNARARSAVSLTTTGSSGAATYNSDSGVFNIPNYGSALSGYLPLSGGTLTGGLYINPQNTSTVGLDVASNTVTLRSDNLEGFKRQLTTTMSSGTLIKIQAAGYGGTYVTDLGFYTSSNSAVNTTPNLYLTGGDNRVGINTITPGFTLDVQGTAGVSGVLTLGSTISNGTYTYTLPSATGTLALNSDLGAYLPLTGGTLTGTLNGTNITITNSLIAKGGTFNGGALSGGVVTIDGLGSDLLMNRADTSNGASITLLTNAVEKWNIGLRSAGTTDNFFIYNSTLLANALTINSATSAATFASSATATNFILSEGTGNTGLYYGHTDRVVLANYTTGGIDFEVNEGSIVATLFPSGNYGLGIALDAGYKLDVNGTARISGALSGTSASFSSSVTASSFVKSGGTSSQFLKADGSVDSNTYLTTSSASSTYVSGSGTTNYISKFAAASVLGNSNIQDSGTLITLGSDTAINGLISGTITKVLPTGNTFAGQTFNITGSANGWNVVSRNTWNINDDAFTTVGFVVTDNRAIINRSSTAANGWGAYSGNVTNNGSVVQGGIVYSGITVGSGNFNSAIIYRAGGSGPFSNTNTYTNYYAFTAEFSPLNITNFYGVNISDVTASTITRALNLRISLGTGKYNIYAGGTANNYLAGNLLIGSTADNGSKLQVTGAATFSSSVTATTGLTVGSLGSGSDAIITLATNASGSPRSIYYKASTATINFTSTGGGDLVTITNAGNVGIGTTSPGASLHVVGNAPNSAIISTAHASVLYTTYRYNTSVDVGYIGNGSGVASGGSASDFGIQALGNFVVTAGGSTERMRITSVGFLGVNQTSPAQRLDVSGAIRSGVGISNGAAIAKAVGRTLYKVIISSNYDAGGAVRGGEWNVLLSNEGDAVTNTTQIYNYNNQSATFTVSGGNLIVNSLSSGNTICAVYTN